MIGGLVNVSIGKLLLAGIGPGLMIASFFIIYLIIRGILNPKLTPKGITEAGSKWRSLLKLLTLAFPAFSVTGLIFFGIASPTEASATGAFATLLLTIGYRRLNWSNFKDALLKTAEGSAAVFVIMACARAYSEILMLTGAAKGIEAVCSITVAPIIILLGLLAVIFIMGCWVDQSSNIFVCAPAVAIVIATLGFNGIWVAVLFSALVGMGGITPPFGLNLFGLKSVLPEDFTMREIYKAAFPYISMELVAVALLVMFPAIGLWIPNL
jgi:tripartite ATP-independent transporter DctM subunit